VLLEVEPDELEVDEEEVEVVPDFFVVLFLVVFFFVVVVAAVPVDADPAEEEVEPLVAVVDDPVDPEDDVDPKSPVVEPLPVLRSDPELPICGGVINKTAPSEHTAPVPIINARFIYSSFLPTVFTIKLRGTQKLHRGSDF